ncbi:VOC family protein [Trujillonella endophytica]|nr:VOC family protein [Trujillella endophytica]
MLTGITISQIYVPDQDAALDFYVGNLGFAVHSDMQFGPMRWLTVVPPGQPDRQVLLEKPGPPSMSEETAAEVRQAISKGVAGGHLFLACVDAYRTHADLKAAGVEITEEPVDQPYGIDFGLRDPFGNHLRIAQLMQA